LKPSIRIALVGDRDDTIPAHRAAPLALADAARAIDSDLVFEWIATDSIEDRLAVSAYDGVWCVPGSPYRSLDGALFAIHEARERRIPFLGTCGGFQHAVLEFARHVLGWRDADHAESAPDAARPVITMLACALVEVSAPIRIVPATRLAAAYGCDRAVEGYRCRYGLNPAFREALTSGPLRIAAEDEKGEVRGLELDDHPFFVATLFQPERAVLHGRRAPLVEAFVAAALGVQPSTRRSPPPASFG